MPRRNIFLLLAALAGAVIFALFLVRILLLRFERGDVYPAYSTLRADPLGARAMYEALGSIPGYSASRGITFLHRELALKPATLVYLGFDANDLRSFSKEEVAELDEYITNGGRVIITFAPERSAPSTNNFGKDPEDKKKPEKKPPAKEEKPKPATEKKEDDATASQTAEEKFEREELRKDRERAEKFGEQNERAYKYRLTLTALWGFGEDEHASDEDKKKPEGEKSKASDDDGITPDTIKEKPTVMANRSSENGLEKSVPWKSAIYFLRLEPDWTPLYTAKEKPVMIWRKRGKGEIIIASDSYFISNEGLREDRRPILLNLLAGSPGRVLFDETHLGTEEQEGVMFLLEKYRLEGYLLGLLGVLGLFLWRNSVPLVPPQPARATALGGIVSGKDSRSGLVNLLRRNIPLADVLKISLAEWKRSITPTQSSNQAKSAAMDAKLGAAVTKRPDEIVRLYHELREINNPSRTPSSYATKS